MGLRVSGPSGLVSEVIRLLRADGTVVAWAYDAARALPDVVVVDGLTYRQAGWDASVDPPVRVYREVGG